MLLTYQFCCQFFFRFGHHDNSFFVAKHKTPPRPLKFPNHIHSGHREEARIHNYYEHAQWYEVCYDYSNN